MLSVVRDCIALHCGVVRCQGKVASEEIVDEIDDRHEPSAGYQILRASTNDGLGCLDRH
jgi:hypothetical protein